MPIPKPKTDETLADFMARCMADETMVGEYEPCQRFAVCRASYTDKKKQKPKNDTDNHPGKK